MRTEIIYASKTGHSKKLANAIGKALNVSPQSISANPSLSNVDLLYIVGGIYGGKSLPELIDYVKKLDRSMVKKVILITSSASKTAKQDEIRAILKERNINVSEDEFTCQGSFLIAGFMHPNKSDIENAVSFAKEHQIIQVC